jgi:hypothetical protein
MSTAVVTFTYNESVNLPIWLRYYGTNFGEDNLYVVDRGSDDASLDRIGKANLLKVPRKKFDEFEKTNFIATFHRSLLNFYDAVIITDCDEILVPDPEKFPNLREYIDGSDFSYVSGIGIDVLHILTEEPPLDLAQPVMRQRRYGRFNSPSCKILISREPVEWLPGFHSSNKPPKFDGVLYCFHTKSMDYSIATKRQMINQNTVWSEQSLAQNLGAHHRFDINRFVHQFFFVPADLVNRGQVQEFDFSGETEQIVSEAVQHKGSYYIPMNISKLVRIPDRFRGVF